MNQEFAESPAIAERSLLRRGIMLAIIAATGLGLGFWAYGGMRTWSNTFGFSLMHSAGTFLVTIIFLLPVQVSPAALVTIIVVPVMRRIPALRRILPIGGLVAVAGLSLYWSSTESADATTLMAGLAFLWIAIPLLTAPLFSRPHFSFRRPVAVLLVAIVSGCVLSESAIVYDETAFGHEVSELHFATDYRRPRAWPNGSSDMVYFPGRGFGATD